MSSPSFADLGVSKPVVEALASRGIDHPFAIQQLVVEDALEGRDVLAKSPTGTGKTLAFGLPIVELLEANTRARPAALILAPTRELATQIVDELHDIAHARALKVKAVYGGVGLEKQAREAAKAHIIVATPGRLEDLLQRRAFSLSDVGILVLDEADRMLDMGFRPVVDRIVAQCPADRQTLFFSATLDGEAGKIAEAYTEDPARHEFKPKEQKVSDIEHRFVAVKHEQRIDALVAELRRDRELALVFVRTKRGADRLVKRLGTQGVSAVAMHGDKSQSQREKALARFERGDVDTLVATDVAARGIDIDGISHVIQFDPPEDREGYVHRVGRTGRAGRTGIGITFVKDDQAADMAKIAGELKLSREFEGSGLRSNATAGNRVAAPRQQRNGTGAASGSGQGRNRRRQRSRAR
ncbi:MAG TPA: DEAD/DEAH box helicase [Capillimicrobium sp.]|jgi:superfamily II DNA/RNA helicase